MQRGSKNVVTAVLNSKIRARHDVKMTSSRLQVVSELPHVDHTVEMKLASMAAQSGQCSSTHGRGAARNNIGEFLGGGRGPVFCCFIGL